MHNKKVQKIFILFSIIITFVFLLKYFSFKDSEQINDLNINEKKEVNTLSSNVNLNSCKEKIIHPDDPKNINKKGQFFVHDDPNLIINLKEIISECEESIYKEDLPELNFELLRVYLTYYIKIKRDELDTNTEPLLKKIINLVPTIINYSNDFYTSYLIFHTSDYSEIITKKKTLELLDNLVTYDFFSNDLMEFLYLKAWTIYEQYIDENRKNLDLGQWPITETSKNFLKAFENCGNQDKKKTINRDSNSKTEYDLAHNYYIDECNSTLGYAFLYGHGTEVNESLAIKFLSKSETPYALYFSSLISIAETENENLHKLEKKMKKILAYNKKKLSNKKIIEDERVKFQEFVAVAYSVLAELNYEKKNYADSLKFIKLSNNEIEKFISWYHNPSYVKYFQNPNNLNHILILNNNSELDQDYAALKKDDEKKEFITNLFEGFSSEEMSDLFSEINQNSENISFLLLEYCFEEFPKNPICLNRLGLAYDNGYGVARNKDKAFEFYKRSYDLDFSYAANNLGYNYYHGGFDKIDYDKAKFYYEKSSELDEENFLAYNNLGVAYLEGLAVEKDIKKATALFEKASELGNLEANINLGDIYSDSSYNKIDCGKSLYYYKKTANADDYDWKTSVTDSYDVDIAKQKIKNLSKSSICNSTQPQKGKNYALLIGIQNYQFFQKLKTPLNDIKLISNILTEKFNYEVILSEDETRTKILTKFEEMRKKVTYKDNLFIYYAGHGEYDEEIQQSWWVPVDGEIDSDINYISTNNLKKKLNKFKANKILLISDSCFSGGLFRGVRLTDAKKSNLNEEQEENERTRLAITSGGLEPVLDSTDDLNYSVFAYSLYKTLDEKRSLNSASLFYLIQKKTEAVFKKLNIKQSPEFAPLPRAGHLGGNYYFTTK